MKLQLDNFTLAIAREVLSNQTHNTEYVIEYGLLLAWEVYRMNLSSFKVSDGESIRMIKLNTATAMTLEYLKNRLNNPETLLKTFQLAFDSLESMSVAEFEKLIHKTPALLKTHSIDYSLTDKMQNTLRAIQPHTTCTSEELIRFGIHLIMIYIAISGSEIRYFYDIINKTQVNEVANVVIKYLYNVKLQEGS